MPPQVETLRARRWALDENERPNDAALGWASKCVTLANVLGLPPTQVTGTAVGGAAVVFYAAKTPGKARRYAALECDNDGDIVALMSDRLPEHDADAWQVERTDKGIAAAIERFRAFLNG